MLSIMATSGSAIGPREHRDALEESPFPVEIIITLNDVTVWSTHSHELQEIDVLPRDRPIPWILSLADLMAVTDLLQGDCGGDVGGPGPAFGEPQAEPASAAGETAGGGEQAQPEQSQLPAAGGPGWASIQVQARSSQAKATISHQTWFRAKPFREVPQPGGLARADAVLDDGVLAVQHVDEPGVPAAGAPSMPSSGTFVQMIEYFQPVSS
jgi:hypothetical protein